MKPKPTINEAVKDTFKQIYSGNNKKMLDNLGKPDNQIPPAVLKVLDKFAQSVGYLNWGQLVRMTERPEDTIEELQELATLAVSETRKEMIAKAEEKHEQILNQMNPILPYEFVRGWGSAIIWLKAEYGAGREFERKQAEPQEPPDKGDIDGRD